ncbi:MAG: 4Fe-4S dicluster domain-containing protein [Spartobacteria bacterium]|nr:4Fe-4S dicluster domain-containing protein [Spartobacteria bacterium]
MIKSMLARIRQGYQTFPFPKGEPPALPDRFRGRPVIHQERCVENCEACIQVCPTNAIARDSHLRIDMGRCLFCGACREACPARAIEFEQHYHLSSGTRGGLISHEPGRNELGAILRADIHRVFGRSLKLRQVCAGGCGACEADVNVLGTIGWDLGRFGIQFVAAPRHADGLLITGPVTQNMKLALQKTYDAVPSPKVVITVGACAISGGLYANHPETCAGVEDLFPIDLYIPGCPPHPLTILSGLISLLTRSPSGGRAHFPCVTRPGRTIG